MFFTSYFGNIRNIPDCLVPISISGKAPEWYKGLEFKKFAPSWDIFSDWKYNHHDNNIYTMRFGKERLAILNPDETIFEILQLTKGKDACFLCYERPGEFCHRHLVADWLTKNQCTTMELNKQTITLMNVFPTRD